MFDKTTMRRDCAKIRVAVRYGADEALDGYVFAREGQRLVDVLNDERTFLPFETLAGEFRAVAKSSIVDLREFRDVKVTRMDDPFAVLGVAKTDSIEEIKRAYLQRLKMAHPDRLAALRLDPAIVDAAKTICQQLNNAYDQIVRERRRAAA